MFSSSKMAVLFERQKQSGLSVRSFCSNEGIAPSTFYYWQKKLRKDSAAGRFIPLLVQAPGSIACRPSGESPVTGTGDTFFEISYPNGTTLRIRDTLDLAGLRSLVSLLD